MKIYDRAGAPNTARVRIVTKAKGLDDRIEFVSINLVAAQQKSDEFLAKNPIGKIPLLELDDGTVISESTAITEYLDNLDGNPILTGRTPRDKALVHMWQRRVEQLFLEPLDDFFHYGTAGLGPNLRPWRMPDWDGRHAWGLRRGTLAVKNLDYFEKELQNRPFLAGDAFSMADITLYISLLFAEIAGLPIGTPSPAISTWRQSVEQLDAVRHRSGTQMPQEDIDYLNA